MAARRRQARNPRPPSRSKAWIPPPGEQTPVDSVTQAALGSAVGGAVLGRRLGWRAFAWGAGLGTLPDLDVLLSYGSPVADFVFHRGVTHALAIQTAAAPLLALPAWWLHRARGVGFGHWLLAVWLILVSHALLDGVTVYGTRLLLPFSDEALGLGSLFIIDPLYSLPLLAGIALALAGRARARARRWNLAGLALSSLYLGWSIVAQQHVHGVAEAALAEAGVRHEALLVTPAPFTTILWRVVAMDAAGDGYYEGYYTVGSGRAPSFVRFPSRPELLEPLSGTPAVERLRAFTDGFYAVDLQGEEVVITDLRMGAAPAYAFAFAVGRRAEGGIEPIPDMRASLPRPPLPRVVGEMLACARGQPVQVIAC